MQRIHHLNRLISALLILAILSACNPGGSSGGRGTSGRSGKSIGISTSNGSGNQSGPSNNTVGSGTSTNTTGVELRFIVDPQDGSYRRKVTIPKNFSGILYIAGLNITSLSSKLVSVRFKFGRELEPIVVEATVARGQGLTPQTDAELLAIDMRDMPFKNIRLLYDLYDYSSYNFDVSTPATPDTPVTSNRDVNLYCRGLDLTYDSTFSGTACDGSTVDESSWKCLYTYAKIKDTGLYNTSTNLYVSPYEAQFDLSSTSSGYYSDSDTNILKKCLPDNYSASSYQVKTGSTVAFNGSVTLNSVAHTFKGPYRAYNTSQWGLTSNAIYDSGAFKYGLFYSRFAGCATATDPNCGYRSRLFPRFGKLNVRENVQHLSHTNPGDIKSVTSLPANGTSDWMDGCSTRVTSYDSYTGEGIGSCNVSATVEVIEHSGLSTETVLSSVSDVKIQLVRPSVTNTTTGQEVLYTSFKSCTSSKSCGGSECCFNNRCWSKELVSRCIDDTSNNTGNAEVGQSCSTDFDCSSLCCNRATSKCSVHNTNLTTPVYCSKSPGEACIAKEWCSKQAVQKCYIVKTGVTTQGNTTCALRCYNYLEFGDCKSGVCSPPISPAVPSFDPQNPDCSKAIDLPPPGFQ